LKTAFSLFDKDGGGSISAQEVAEMLGRNAHIQDEAVWQRVIEQVDLNGDGEIDFEEFK
jgi:Ca2+-binding EF-hand superfamily protein